jgi:hypothetical protein
MTPFCFSVFCCSSRLKCETAQFLFVSECEQDWETYLNKIDIPPWHRVHFAPAHPIPRKCHSHQAAERTFGFLTDTNSNSAEFLLEQCG